MFSDALLACPKPQPASLAARKRSYDPSAGRFTSMDPADFTYSNPVEVNRYGYAGANPVANGDPTGQFIVSLGIGNFFAGMISGGRDVATLSTGARALYSVTRAARLAGMFAESGLYLSLYNEGSRLAERDRVVGTGGADVTNVLRRTADKVGAWWNTLTPEQSRVKYSAMYSFVAGWDATPLQSDIDIQRIEFSGGAGNWAPRSVSIDGNVYYAHEANYFFWGYMNAEASKKGAPVTETGMLEWVVAYRGATGPIYANLPGAVHDGSLYGRAAWAQAGWNYAKTRTFKPPTAVALPNATPSNAVYPGYLGRDTFRVNIQGFTVPLN